jgi:hypothetical protein
MAQVVSRRLLTAEPRYVPRSVQVGFVMDKVAMGQVFLLVLLFSLVLLYHLGDEQ